MNVASILARLGLDTSGFTNGLRAAEQQATGAHGRMAGAVGRNTAAHDDLWKSENRIERQISNVARTALSGADAFEVAAASVEALGKSLQLSLGAAAGIGVGVAFFEKIYKAREEANKLHESVRKLTAESNGNARFESLDRLVAKLDEVQKKADEIKGGEGGFFKGLFKQMGSFLPTGHGSFDVLGDMLQSHRESGERDQADKDALAKAARQTNADIAAKVRSEADLSDLKRSGPGYLADAQKATDADMLRRKSLTNGDSEKSLGESLNRLLENALKDIAESVASKRKERVALNLGELASLNENDTTGLTNESAEARTRDIRAARQAQAYEGQGNLLKSRGDIYGAQEQFSKAQEIKNGIGILKDSEKDLKGELTGALDASEVLKDIRANTGRGLTNR